MRDREVTAFGAEEEGDDGKVKAEVLRIGERLLQQHEDAAAGELNIFLLYFIVPIIIYP